MLYWPSPFSPPSFLEAWSITYHSWLTFVLLIWSCTLWMIRNRRKYAMISSPFMVVYGNLLLILQYIWSFELPEIKKVPGFLEKKEPGELASKVSERQSKKTKHSDKTTVIQTNTSKQKSTKTRSKYLLLLEIIMFFLALRKMLI